MVRKLLCAAILATGLTQMANAQAQDQQRDFGKPAVPQTAAASADSKLAAPAPPAASATAGDANQPPAASAKIATAAAHEPDPAEKDLAAVPPEEPRPGLIDPNVVRRAMAKAGRDASPTRDEANSAPQPALAATVAPARTGQVIQSASAQPPAERADDRRSRPAADNRGMDDRAAYADRDANVRSASPEDDRAAQRGFYYKSPDAGSLYANEDRDSRLAFPYTERDPHGYGDPANPDSVPPAIDDSATRTTNSADAPADRQYGDRGSDRFCDGEQTDRLQQKVHREAETGLIERSAAQDLVDEIGYAERLRRSYCASGMNEWREDRIIRQYSQIEDRFRYEEGNGRQR